MRPELSDFLVELATDPARMSSYLADPEAVMTAAGLSDAEQTALQDEQSSGSGTIWMTGLSSVTIPPDPEPEPIPPAPDPTPTPSPTPEPDPAFHP